MVVRYHTMRMMQAAQNVHDTGYQDVLRARHSNGMWDRGVGKFLQYMGKTY